MREIIRLGELGIGTWRDAKLDHAVPGRTGSITILISSAATWAFDRLEHQATD